ncbi:MAG TPA: hypothetical protein VHH53_00750 [Pseudonocardiaceae bacterium]|nr:hypothetical protein [Pseudonocardiaceae bacterium]
MTRLRAGFLLLLFLAAGTSLPSLDALLYHGAGAETQKAQNHLEPTGGCLDHDGHCGLGRTAPGTGAVAPRGDAPLLKHDHGAASPLKPGQSGPSPLHDVLPPPRAPPASRV